MRGNLPGVDPVLCYLVWEPRSPVMWWLDTWDMASDGKETVKKVQLETSTVKNDLMSAKNQ